MKEVIYKKTYLNLLIRVLVSVFIPLTVLFFTVFILSIDNIFSDIRIFIYLLFVPIFSTIIVSTIYIFTFKTFVFLIHYEDGKIIFNFSNWFTKRVQIIDLKNVIVNQGIEQFGVAGFQYLSFRDGKKMIFKMISDLGMISLTKKKDVINLYNRIIELQNQLKLQNGTENQENDGK